MIFSGKSVCILAITLFALMISGCAKPVANIPTGWVTFQPQDAAFSCDAPNNWQTSSFSEMGTDSGVNFVSGSAKINITSSMVGSLLGDIATSNNNQAENLASELGTQAQVAKPPAEQAHEQFAAAMQHQYSDYTELNELPVQSKAGQGWISEFTYDFGMTHGYRATFLGKDRSIEIICSCPQDEWTALQGSFEHVIESVTPGTDG